MELHNQAAKRHVSRRKVMKKILFMCTVTMLPARMSRDVARIMVKWQPAESPSMAIHRDNEEVESRIASWKIFYRFIVSTFMGKKRGRRGIEFLLR